MTEKQTFNLYNNEVAIEFYPNSHRYKLVGERTYLISVTAITGIIDKSRVLINWAINDCCIPFIENFLTSSNKKTFRIEELLPVLEQASKQHEIKKTEAGSVGKEVHEFAEKYSLYKTGKGEMPELPDNNQARNGINAFLDWYLKHDVKFLEAERLVYSKKYGFVGMADGIAIVNGKKYLIDYKTGNGIYNEHYLQVTGYRIAYEEETGEKLDGALILHFNKMTGEFEKPRFISDFDHEANIPAFLAAYELKKRDKELNKINF